MNQNNLVACKNHINSVADKFKSVLHKSVSDIDFIREATFATQYLEGNDYLIKMALQNPKSLQNAIINIASIGLSLNPANRHAYLVPRKGGVCLDVSYIGLVKLATDAGAVEYVQSKLVYRNDSFETHGISKEPTHSFNPFGDRGELVGVYCVAKLKSGEFLTEIMSKEECYSIRHRSDAYASGRSCPWKTDEGEMMKKTVIKRAVKLYPSTGMDRINKAIHVINEHEGINFDQEKRDRANEVAAKDRDIKEETYKEKREIISKIKEYESKLNSEMTVDEKCAFMERYLEVSKHQDLIKKNIADLKEIELNLFEMSQGESNE